MDARFHRTAMVLQGWTMHQPRHPPRPEVAKIADLERVGGEEVASARGCLGRDSDIIIFGILISPCRSF